MGSHPPARRFTMDDGHLRIASIEFEGRRGQGEDVFFTTDWGQPLEVFLGDGTTNFPVVFDIPQGIYNHLEIILNLYANNTPSLTMHGVLDRGPMRDMPVRFEYQHHERIRIRGSGPQGRQVVLLEDQPATATVELDTGHLLRLVNMGMIMNAGVVEENGEEVVLISETSNSSTYNMIANRLAGAFTLAID